MLFAIPCQVLDEYISRCDRASQGVLYRCGLLKASITYSPEVQALPTYMISQGEHSVYCSYILVVSAKT